MDKSYFAGMMESIPEELVEHTSPIQLIKMAFYLYLFYQVYCLYFIPTNRVKGLNAFGSVRSDRLKVLSRYHESWWSSLANDSTSEDQMNQVEQVNQVNQVRKRQRFGTMPPPYPNGWFVILESSDLTCRQVKSLYVLGFELVVFRTASGAVRVVDSICPHLGASLSQGVVRQEDIECPFHRWRFNGETGSVSSVPYSSQKTASLKRFNIRTWPVVEVNGLVLLWHHAEDEDPDWTPEEHESIARGDMEFYGRTEHTVAAHIQDLPENGADPAHLDAIHRKVFAAGGELGENATCNWITHHWQANWRPSSQERHEAELHVQAAFKLFDKYTFYDNKVYVRQLGPSLVQMEFSGPLGSGVVFQCVTPVGPLRQRVLHRIYWQRFYGLGPLIAKFYLCAEAIQFERDVRVWNNKDHLVRPCLVKEDHLIAKFRRWYSQFYSKNSRRPFQIINSIDI